MTEATLRKTIFIEADPQTVWGHLIEGERLAQWFHPASEDLEAGKPYELISRDTEERIIWGEVLEAEAPRRLVVTMSVEALEERVTRVVWTLEAAFGGTVLTLTHSGFDDADGLPAEVLGAMDRGWDEHLADLREAP